MKEESFPNAEQIEKRQHWDETAARVEKITDRLEKPIDEGIKEGVIALNVFDINTAASCEGHIDRGTYAPWINIQAEIPRDLIEEIGELSKDREGNKVRLKEISKDIERRNLEEQKKVFAHLELFYQNREAPFHKRLAMGYSGLGRLQSQGAELQKIEDAETRKERLKEYQEEMNAFISFLKEEYFKSEK
ncbi:MAG TPA: hypothetical protein VMR99_00185 [Candidatus Paceibacterota bacterium]|nr:hypothetical protein [Candidatus Paceibacterota bacterium]